MGLPDSYRLPARYNDAYHLTGDGVVVDVVRHLSEHVLLPAIAACATKPARKRVRRAA
jgi:DNA (cytosine-5)-methyltransferase 1